MSVHLYGFYALVAVVLLHIAPVVITEVREGADIIPAMFTGRKVSSTEPAEDPRRTGDAGP